jgi:2-methylisocitrate lyase-like PEP mutase family enzyme
MTPSFREIHAAAKPLITPLAHDALSARLIARAGFKAFNIGGSTLFGARYALPDLGLGALGEMVAAIKDILDAVPLPCMADADDGYGDAKSVTRTIEMYQSIGVSGALLEDQARDGKQPGAQAARAVVPLALIEQKLRAALAARRDRDFVVIGRTDANGAEGLDEALRRGERFLSLGADGVFVAGLKTPEQYERVGRAFKGSWNAGVMFEGGRTPWISPQDLYAMGFSQISYPNSLILRIVKTMEDALQRLKTLEAGGNTTLGGNEELAFETYEEALALGRWRKIEEDFS